MIASNYEVIYPDLAAESAFSNQPSATARNKVVSQFYHPQLPLRFPSSEKGSHMCDFRQIKVWSKAH